MDEEHDRNLRKDFARVFGWFENRAYSYREDPKTPTWAEIFAEVGRLKALSETNR